MKSLIPAKRMFHISISLILVCLTILGSPLYAQMVLSDIILDFENGKQLRRNVEVKNTGKETLYISVTVNEVIKPGKTKLQRRELKNPRTASLLVSPKRMRLRPGQRRLLRVVVRKPAIKKDRIYHVTVKPVIGKVKSKQNMAVKIMIGYEMLVIVRPPNAKPRLRVRRSGKFLKFFNAGNTNVLLRRIRQCNKNKSNCVDLPSKRIYAKQRWKVKLPRKGPVEIVESVGLKHSIKEY